jgi:hypothetical protein
LLDKDGEPRGWTARQEAKIKATKTRLTERLIQCASGETEMTQTELKAAEMLLRRVWPERKPVDAKGDADGKLVISWEK